MQTDQALRFGPYRLDLAHGQVWRGTHAVKLTPKAPGRPLPVSAAGGASGEQRGAVPDRVGGDGGE